VSARNYEQKENDFETPQFEDISEPNRSIALLGNIYDL